MNTKAATPPPPPPPPSCESSLSALSGKRSPRESLVDMDDDEIMSIWHSSPPSHDNSIASLLLGTIGLDGGDDNVSIRPPPINDTVTNSQAIYQHDDQEVQEVDLSSMKFVDVDFCTSKKPASSDGETANSVDSTAQVWMSRSRRGFTARQA